MSNIHNNKDHFMSSISHRGLIILYIYYTILILFGICLFSFVTIVNNLGDNPFTFLNSILVSSSNENHGLNLHNLAFIGSISSSLLGASVSYIKKIYQMSIGNLFNITKVLNNESFGSLLYFIYRPIFAIIFSLVIFSAIKIGIIPIISSNSEITSNTVDFCMLISFFIGLNAGKLLNILENSGNKIVDSIGSAIDNASN